MKRSHFLISAVCGASCLMTGCVSHVFKEPLAVSTKSSVYEHVQLTGQSAKAVSANGFFVLIPVVSDPRKAWGQVLDDAKRKQCNAVVDLQYRQAEGGFVWMFPPIVWVPTELEGTAARIR